MKYKYILLDIDNTLIDFDESFKTAAEKVIELGGKKPTRKNRDLYHKLNDDAWFGLNLEDVNDPYIVENYHPLYHKYLELSLQYAVDALELQGDFNELLSCANTSLGIYATINEGVMETLEKLSKTHILCIATNGVTDVQPYKIEHFKKYISYVFISEEIGYFKPAKAYYEHILRTLNCSASECLMVGDSLVNDISGAINSGIDACYYNPKSKENTSGITPTYEINHFSELLDIV